MKPKQTNETEFANQDKISAYLTNEQFEEIKREHMEWIEEESRRNQRERRAVIALMVATCIIAIFCALYQILLPLWR